MNKSGNKRRLILVFAVLVLAVLISFGVYFGVRGKITGNEIFNLNEENSILIIDENLTFLKGDNFTGQIAIAKGGITLDCNGGTIKGYGTSFSEGIVIYSNNCNEEDSKLIKTTSDLSSANYEYYFSPDIYNITIKNCKIEGFSRGINLVRSVYTRSFTSKDENGKLINLQSCVGPEKPHSTDPLIACVIDKLVNSEYSFLGSVCTQFQWLGAANDSEVIRIHNERIKYAIGTPERVALDLNYSLTLRKAYYKRAENFYSKSIQYLETPGVLKTSYSSESPLFSFVPREIILENLEITNCTDGIYIDAYSSNFLINNSYIYNNSNGIYLELGSSNTKIINSRIVDNKNVGVAIDSSFHNDIENNLFERNGHAGISLYKNCGEMILGSSTYSPVRYSGSNFNLIKNNSFINHNLYPGQFSNLPTIYYPNISLMKDPRSTGIWIASREGILEERILTSQGILACTGNLYDGSTLDYPFRGTLFLDNGQQIIAWNDYSVGNEISENHFANNLYNILYYGREVPFCNSLLTSTAWSSWLNVSSCRVNNTVLQRRSLTQYDANNCGEIANQTFYEYQEIACDYCTPLLANTSWSSWTNLFCVGNQKNQSRFLTQYDTRNCGEIANRTFYSSQLVGPLLSNTSWSGWTSISCLPTNFINQSRTLTEYDSYSCKQNTTYTQYQTSVACDYCTPLLYNQSTSWSNIQCLATNQMNQTRNLTQTDSNGCYAKTGLASDYVALTIFKEYRLTESCDFCTPSLYNTTWSSWTNQTDCYSNGSLNQRRNKVQYDLQNCEEVSNQTFYEYQSANCIYSSSENNDNSGSSSGGGSGGGGGGGSSSGNSYSVAEGKLKEGYSAKLYKGNKVTFSVGSQNHSVAVNSISANSANISVASNPQYKVLVVGESWEVDLDEDNSKDIKVTLNNITSYTNVGLSVIDITNPKTTEVSLVIKDNSSNSNLSNGNSLIVKQDKNLANKMIILFAIIFVIVLIIALVALFWDKIKKAFLLSFN